jgi:hypothetical protein
MRQAPPPLTEQQHLDVAVSVGAVLGHLGGRDRDGAEHVDLRAWSVHPPAGELHGLRLTSTSL